MPDSCVHCGCEDRHHDGTWLCDCWLDEELDGLLPVPPVLKNVLRRTGWTARLDRAESWMLAGAGVLLAAGFVIEQHDYRRFVERLRDQPACRMALVGAARVGATPFDMLTMVLEWVDDIS